MLWQERWLPARAPSLASACATLSVTASVSELPSVQQVVAGEANMPEMAGTIYDAVSAGQRLQRLTSGNGLLQQTGHRAAMVGWRSISVWSQRAGSGD